MKYILTLAALAALIGAGYYAVTSGKVSTFEQKVTDPVALAAQVMAEPATSTDEIEARAQALKEASEGLKREEERLLAEIAQASSSAASQIAQIEAERDAKIAERQAKIERINEIRAGF